MVESIIVEEVKNLKVKPRIFNKKIDLAELISSIKTKEPVTLQYSLNHDFYSDIIGNYDGGTVLNLRILTKKRKYETSIKINPGPGIFDSKRIAENYLTRFKKILEII